MSRDHREYCKTTIKDKLLNSYQLLMFSIDLSHMTHSVFHIKAIFRDISYDDSANQGLQSSSTTQINGLKYFLCHRLAGKHQFICRQLPTWSKAKLWRHLCYSGINRDCPKLYALDRARALPKRSGRDKKRLNSSQDLPRSWSNRSSCCCAREIEEFSHRWHWTRRHAGLWQNLLWAASFPSS